MDSRQLVIWGTVGLGFGLIGLGIYKAARSYDPAYIRMLDNERALRAMKPPMSSDYARAMNAAEAENAAYYARQERVSSRLRAFDDRQRADLLAGRVMLQVPRR